MASKNRFNRQELYDLAWSIPISRLAADFYLSDVMLHRICRKQDIPTPPRGWWAKKLAGKKVERTPLPRGVRAEDDIAIVRDEARRACYTTAQLRKQVRSVPACFIDETASKNETVERTIASLRAAKPGGPAGMVKSAGAAVIMCEVMPSSIDRCELALNRIMTLAEASGIELISSIDAATLYCDGETIGISLYESVKRTKHVLTKQEELDLRDHEREKARYWKRWSRYPDRVIGDRPQRPATPEWDYVATGRLTIELERTSLRGGRPRRSFRETEVKRLQSMASDIAIAVTVLAAAKKQDRLLRQEQAARREDDRKRREQALRDSYVEERRRGALGEILDDFASLERLRHLVASLRAQLSLSGFARVTTFLAFAERRLTDAEATFSTKALDHRFSEHRLFGGDDDHDFRLPPFYEM